MPLPLDMIAIGLALLYLLVRAGQLFMILFSELMTEPQELIKERELELLNQKSYEELHAPEDTQ